MKVAAEGPVIPRDFAQENFVATLIQMPGPPIPLSTPAYVTGQPMLHAVSKIRFSGLDQGVNVILDPAVR